MSQFLLSNVADLLSHSLRFRPVLLRFQSTKSTSPFIIILCDTWGRQECRLEGEAENRALTGLVCPGDVVSVTRTEEREEGVVVLGIERVAKGEGGEGGFDELQAAAHNQPIDVKARVCSIGQQSTYQSSFGRKPFFNLALLDYAGNELIASFFDEQATKFHNFCVEGMVYKFMHFNVDRGQKKPTSRLRFSLTASPHSSILELPSSLNFPSLSFTLLPYSSIQQQPVDTVIDLAGVVTHIGDLSTDSTKSTKRIISLVNSRNQRAEVTLWGSMAKTDYSAYMGQMPILVVKYAQVRDPAAIKLTTFDGLSRLIFDVRGLSEVESLLLWKESLPRNPEEYIPLQAPADSLRVPKTVSQTHCVLSISEMKRDSLVTGWDHKFDIEAQIHKVCFATIKDIMYPACVKLRCLKGVRMEEDGTYQCVKCGTKANRCTYRYMLKLALRGEEQGEEVLATAFDKVSEELLGVSAETVRRQEEAEGTIRSIEGKWHTFTLQRNTKDLRAAEGYIIESLNPCKRPECDID